MKRIIFVFLVSALLTGVMTSCGQPVISSLTNSIESPKILTVKSVKISQGDLFANKTYVNDFVESPNGSKLLYRYFPNPSFQPSGRTGKGLGAQMWMCDPDGNGQVKLYDILNVGLWSELGHGSEAMVWIDDDKFYYNGILYQFSRSSILWKIQNPVDAAVQISAWSNPVGEKLFINIRSGSNAGYYWINPFQSTEPKLNTVIDREKMKPFLNGDPSKYEFTYIKLSPGGSHLFFVMYVNSTEFGFTSKADGTEITPLGDYNNSLLPFNGHAIWYDDERLIYPSYADQTTKICDRFGKNAVVVAGKTNHITVSPDKKWLV